MISIICFPDGDLQKGLPIMNEDEEGYPSVMATWETEKEAREFIWGHPLSGSSTILLINLEEDEITWL